MVLIVIVNQLIGGDDGNGGAGASGYNQSRLSDSADTGRYDNCKTGQDANESQDCARVAVENSLTDYWEDELGGKFRPEGALVTFTGGIDTQCGPATSDVGPFYCPTDESIYLDTDFFAEVLERQLGGPRGGFVEFLRAGPRVRAPHLQPARLLRPGAHAAGPHSPTPYDSSCRRTALRACGPTTPRAPRTRRARC